MAPIGNTSSKASVKSVVSKPLSKLPIKGTKAKLTIPKTKSTIPKTKVKVHESETHEPESHESETHESETHESETHESETHKSDPHESEAHESDEFDEVQNQEDVSLSATPVQKSKIPMNQKAFREKLKTISNAMNDLATLEEAISTVHKGEALRYKDVYIHRRDVTSYRMTIRHEVEALYKDYDLALKYRKKIKSDTRRVVQFVRKLKPDAVELICSKSSNLGLVNGEELYVQLPMLAKEGLVLNTTLMSLASIYTRKNQLGVKGNSLKASDQMRVLLEPYRSELETKGFKFDDFNCTRWSTIWSIMKEDIPSKERASIMESRKDELIHEESIVSNVLQKLK